MTDFQLITLIHNTKFEVVAREWRKNVMLAVRNLKLKLF